MNKNIISLLTILEAIAKIKIYSSKYDNYSDFLWADQQRDFNASINLLIAIGEEVNKIDQKLKDQNPEVIWKDIVGMRNILSHNYRGIDAELVWNIINEQLDRVGSISQKILFSIINQKDDLKVFLESPFYSNIKYLID